MNYFRPGSFEKPLYCHCQAQAFQWFFEYVKNNLYASIQKKEGKLLYYVILNLEILGSESARKLSNMIGKL